MTNEDVSIESRLKDYIESVKDKPLEHGVEELSSKHLINDLGMDSLDIINMLFQIEENEKVDISEEDRSRIDEIVTPGTSLSSFYEADFGPHLYRW